MKRVAVIGGGIAGLASAYRIGRLAAERGLELRVEVIEAGARPGGKVATANEGGFLCEAGPAGFLDNEPATLRLVEDLGLKDQLLRSNDAARNRYIIRGGEFRSLPMGPLSFLKSNLLSFGGRMDVVKELFRKPRLDGVEETVAQFGTRRLGKEFTQILLDSMVSGIHAGDISRLSLKAAFPKIVSLEQEHGGLIKGMMALQKERKRAAKKGEAPTAKVEAGPGGVLHSFKDGMAVVTDRLAESLGKSRVRTATRVERVQDYGARGGYRLHLDQNGRDSTLDVDAIVVALPSHAAAELLEDFSEDAATALGEIPFAGVHVVCAGYRRDQVKHPLDGFGALIPRQEGVRVLGTIWSSSTFDGQAPDDHVLLRTLVGGRHDPDATELSDAELMDLVREETHGIYGITGEPSMIKMFRWTLGIPQYELGHVEKVERARADLDQHPGIFLTGNSVCGISFNQCVAHSEIVAQELLDHFDSGRGTAPEREEARA